MPDIVESGKSNITGGYKKAVALSHRLPKIFRSDAASKTRSLQFCTHCGAVLSGQFDVGSQCPACGHVVEALIETPPGLSKEARPPARHAGHERLQQETLKWVHKGFVVVRQKSDVVELRKPKRFSDKWAVAWLIAGIPFPGAPIAYAGGYAIWHATKKERTVILFLGPDGTIRTEKIAS